MCSTRYLKSERSERVCSFEEITRTPIRGGKNCIYFNNSIRSKEKEITLARGLTSVQSKQEINVNRACKTTKTYFLTAFVIDSITGKQQLVSSN